MKIYRCLRYRCDYCKKSGCGKAAMQAHELRCFHNPNRICPMCSESPGQTPLPELIALLDGITWDNRMVKIAAVEKAASGCPACTLAALNQIPPHEVDYEDFDGANGFTRKENWAFSCDYKTARAAWLDDMHRDRVGYAY